MQKRNKDVDLGTLAILYRAKAIVRRRVVYEMSPSGHELLGCPEWKEGYWTGRCVAFGKSHISGKRYYMVKLEGTQYPEAFFEFKYSRILKTKFYRVLDGIIDTKIAFNRKADIDTARCQAVKGSVILENIGAYSIEVEFL